MKDNQFSSSSLFIIPGIIVVGIVVTVILLNIFSLTIEKTDEKETSTITSEEPTTVPPEEPTQNQIQTPEETITLTNEDWGYSINIPKAWPAHTVKETIGTPSGFVLASHEFILTSTTGEDVSFFTISMYTPAQWDNVLFGETLLGESSEFVYAFSQTQQPLPEDLELFINDLQYVQSSFELL